MRVVHRLCKEGHEFTNPLDVKSVSVASITDREDHSQDGDREKGGISSTQDKESTPQEKVAEQTPAEPQQEKLPETTAKPVGASIPSLPTESQAQVPKPAYEVAPPVAQNIPAQPPVISYQTPVEEAKDTRYDAHEYQPLTEYGMGGERVDYGRDMGGYHRGAYSTADQYDDRRRPRVGYQEQTARGMGNRDRTPEPPRRGYSDDNTIKYVRVKNLPPNCDKNKVIDFFANIPIAYANIALVFDHTGRFCQQAILALNNLNDQIDALSQSGRYIFNYQISVEDAIPAEWEQAQQSQKVFFSRDEKILVRMRGLPFTIKKEDILMFFAGYEVVPDSVIIGELGNGKRTGEGVILFKSETEASRAVAEKNGSSIGRRWIELYLHPYSHFHSFYQAQHHEEYVYLNKYITEENKHRTLRIRGLPYNSTKRDLLNFFKDFAVTDNDVVFEIKEGRPTGRALVFMRDPTVAVRAIQALDKEYIGNRYVELEQVSNLPHEF